ncbi:MAG: hypothetical protein ACREBU_01220 [Nitrososphaera sp.]
MSKQAILAFFKPSMPVLVLVSSLVVLSIATQYPWTLNEQERRVFAYFPALIWLFVTAPLLALSWTTIPNFLNPPLVQIFTPLGATASIIYYYLISCVIAYAFRSIKWDSESWRRTQGIKS